MKKTTQIKLFEFTEIERRQIKTHQLEDDIPKSAIESSSTPEIVSIPILNEYLFRNQDIYISKHNRFAPYPAHQHNFLEINYCFSGSVHEIVDGKSITLNKGDLILLDVGCVHSLAELGTDDILVNILFRDQNINLAMLNDIRKNESVLFSFLINRVIKAHKKPSSLIFRDTSNDEINNTLNSIIDEYFSNQEFSNTVIKSYLDILMAQLVRNYTVNQTPVSQTQNLIIKILHDLTIEYATTSLGSIAEKYNYNKNYLSNTFKATVGETFSTVLTRERLIHAHEMIQTTTLPISDIANEVGISNLNFFIKKYKLMYGEMPKETRKKS